MTLIQSSVILFTVAGKTDPSSFPFAKTDQTSSYQEIIRRREHSRSQNWHRSSRLAHILTTLAISHYYCHQSGFLVLHINKVAKRKSVKTVKREEECGICMSKKADTRLRPCNHLLCKVAVPIIKLLPATYLPD